MSERWRCSLWLFNYRSHQVSFSIKILSGYQLLQGNKKGFENMSGRNNSPKSDLHWVKYGRNLHRRPSFEADLSCVNYKPTLSNNERKQCHKNSDLKSPEILNRSRLISAISDIWDSASQSLLYFDPKENVNWDDKGFQKENVLENFGEKINGRASTSNDANHTSVNVRDTTYVSPIMQANMFVPNVRQKIFVQESCNGSQDYIHSLFQKFMYNSINISDEPWKAKELVSEEISFKLGNIYWRTRRNASRGPNYPVKVTEPENMKTAAPVDASTPSLTNEGDDSKSDVLIYDGLPSSTDEMLDARKVTSLPPDHFLKAVHDTRTDIDVDQTLSSRICSDYHSNSLATCDSAPVQSELVIDDNKLLETKQRHFLDTITNEKSEVEVSAKEKPYYPLAKQGHAFSGALAGVCVSLCLHPVDTIKTVIQSCRAQKKSIFYIGQSIVSDRGLPGLYRGISTSIACSAPISAVYTFTYESVKAALLPCLPQEYYSFAHCVAGGCASVATSSIFTPSERIKQQMQVGSHYRNCWDVLVEIIRKGGFHSLYAGWRAVLCRNVPHSIVKFYVYEKLRQVMSSLPSSVRANPFQTLVCGGLAGSTAAFVTTPFDVIKTRLQTQIPGSVNQYHGVFHALCKISKNEGVRGLYRGLTPRLIIYMSQGSLFFASYEFFKRLFYLEA